MENNIRNTEQNKSRFNMIDGFVIILIIAVMFAAFYILDPFNVFVKVDEKDVKLTYVIKFEGVDGDFKDNILVGEIARSANTDYNMGKVVDVKVQNSTKWVQKDDSVTMVKVTLQDKYDVFVTITVDCLDVAGVGYMINGKQIAYGSAVELRFSEFIGSGHCVEFKLAE